MKGVSILSAAIFVFGIVFLAMPQNSYSGIGFTPLGCCVDNNGSCLGCGKFESCSIPQAQCEIALAGNFIPGQSCFEQFGGCGGKRWSVYSVPE